MSTDSFKAFATKIQEDENLRKEIQAASDEKGISADQLAGIAAGHGYEFTVDDVSSELSDAELEGVAGGMARADVSTSLNTLNTAYKIESYNISGTTFLKLDIWG